MPVRDTSLARKRGAAWMKKNRRTQQWTCAGVDENGVNIHDHVEWLNDMDRETCAWKNFGSGLCCNLPRPVGLCVKTGPPADMPAKMELPAMRDMFRARGRWQCNSRSQYGGECLMMNDGNRCSLCHVPRLDGCDECLLALGMICSELDSLSSARTLLNSMQFDMESAVAIAPLVLLQPKKTVAEVVQWVRTTVQYLQMKIGLGPIDARILLVQAVNELVHEDRSVMCKETLDKVVQRCLELDADSTSVKALELLLEETPPVLTTNVFVPSDSLTIPGPSREDFASDGLYKPGFFRAFGPFVAGKIDVPLHVQALSPYEEACVRIQQITGALCRNKTRFLGDESDRDKDVDMECPVCFSFMSGEEAGKQSGRCRLQPCGHTNFCSDCADKFETCPMPGCNIQVLGNYPFP